MARFSGFLAFIFIAPLLAVIFDYALHKVWLEPAGIVPSPEDAGYYLAKFLIVLLTVLALSPIAFTARPVVIGFTGALLFGIYYAVTRPWIPLQNAFIIFLVHMFAIVFAVGLTDGFIKGYGLKGVRSR